MSDDKQYISYNNVHQLCQVSAKRIKNFKPDLIIAIGGGGFIPARILRTFLKEPGVPTVRIFAIILSLYEDLDTVGSEQEQVGVKINRTQWIDYEQCKLDLVGKNVLIVDEVDDTRTTLHYALHELEKDAKEQAEAKGIDVEKCPEMKTNFGIFVLHDKLKPKKADLPDEILLNENRYFAAKQVPDKWYAYPWESTDIVHHTKMAVKQGNDIFFEDEDDI
ncbi:hypoxanthine-guanine phosphoribosyltransferase [Monosporozyma servazzii]